LGDKLKKDLTAYLKNAKLDPTKSIPQPFRSIDADEKEAEEGYDENGRAR
jgi:hypothetical protein